MKKIIYVVILFLLCSNVLTFLYLSSNERREKKQHKSVIKMQNQIIDSLKRMDAIFQSEYFMIQDRLNRQANYIKELESRPEKIRVKYVPLYREMENDTSALIKYLRENL
jgi:hypothetical protein